VQLLLILRLLTGQAWEQLRLNQRDKEMGRIMFRCTGLICEAAIGLMMVSIAIPFPIFAAQPNSKRVLSAPSKDLSGAAADAAKEYAKMKTFRNLLALESRALSKAEFQFLQEKLAPVASLDLPKIQTSGPELTVLGGEVPAGILQNMDQCSDVVFSCGQRGELKQCLQDLQKVYTNTVPPGPTDIRAEMGGGTVLTSIDVIDTKLSTISNCAKSEKIVDDVSNRRGVKLGLSKKRIREMFGKPSYAFGNDSLTYLYSEVRKNPKSPTCSEGATYDFKFKDEHLIKFSIEKITSC
jgi:hypothetical protein